MVELDAVYAGPAVSKMRERSPGSILCCVFDALGVSPENAIQSEAKKAFIEHCRSYPDSADLCFEYSFLNAWAGVNSGPRRRSRTRDRKRSATVTKKSERMVEAMKAVCIMDLILPSGKQVRHSTGAQCKAAGGLFMRIAAKVKPNQIVGKVLTEKQAQALWTGK